MILLVAFILLLIVLFSSLPIGAGLTFLGLTLATLFSDMPLYRALGEVAWAASSNNLLVAIPMFILLGEILLRSGIADRLYSAMAQWLSWLPGGLMHANIGTSMAFAATSGSSVATAATIGTIATPLIDKHEYNERLFLGSLAAGGTLGILIPPSIDLIIYGWLTQTSIPALYMAGFLPGMLLGFLFIVTIGIACSVRPRWGGKAIETNWRQRMESLPALLPPLVLFVVIIASIYMGLATPTESAALGVVCALFLAASQRRLNLNVLRNAIEGTMRTTGIIFFIFAGAWFLNLVISFIGVTATLNQFITTQGLTPFQTLMIITVCYTILGCFMDPLPLIVISVPIVTPVVVAAGYDPIWFGIYFVVLNETALITPPIGLNLFVVQGVRRRGSMNDLIIGVLPFFATLVVMLGLLIVFPEIALWLPGTMK